MITDRIGLHSVLLPLLIKQIRKIAANRKQSISLKLCTLVGQLVELSCYAVGFLKYRVIIEKCANFDDATEAAILTLNFNPTSVNHAFNRLKTQAIV